MKKCNKKIDEMCAKVSDLETSFDSLQNIVAEVMKTQNIKRGRKPKISIDTNHPLS